MTRSENAHYLALDFRLNVQILFEFLKQSHGYFMHAWSAEKNICLLHWTHFWRHFWAAERIQSGINVCYLKDWKNDIWEIALHRHSRKPICKANCNHTIPRRGSIPQKKEVGKFRIRRKIYIFKLIFLWKNCH